ncbi:hypothetical protein EYB53_015380 [Candidatus Chloroploca sp. M-50]|uniref:CARDB domain-containing protein n=1 Tax=Candidatus Chloroploca mongolica TaxID=2528176 RepID=A0ABS4DCC6_9CHLR|nr:hypothetical protein [Candidatus Chloroploca mongolica]MBP1467095.1 hypothetical protein [Candidatus Chloroploca mongolica]
MLRKVTAIALVTGLIMALALVLAPVRSVSAQQGIQWSTGFQVQNLGTAQATVDIRLINPDGTSAANILGESIAAGSSKTYFPIPSVETGFSGSAVIEADQPVAAILNILGNNGVAGQPFYSEAATGLTQGATTVNLPLIQRGNSGFDTWFAVQNAGTAAAPVTVVFTPGPGANDGTADTVTSAAIAPGASLVFDQSTRTELGTRFVGSAQITSAQPVAVVVNQVGKAGFQTQLTYSGFAAGSTEVVLPLVQQANAGFFSGISIQNIGTAAADVTVAYGANTVADGVSLTNETFNLGAGASQAIIVNGADRYIGSAIVTSAQPIVVVVNQLSTQFGTSYEGISSAGATTRVSLPLLMANNGGFFTAVQCRNAGTVSTTATMTFTPNAVPGSTTTPEPETAELAAGQSVTWFQNAKIPTERYIGGATVTTSPASNVVCIVNQLAPANAGDAFLTYNGINF